MGLTAAAIRDALAARGNDVSGPAEERDLLQLEVELNVSLNAYVCIARSTDSQRPTHKT